MLALVDTVPTSCVFVCDAFYDTLKEAKATYESLGFEQKRIEPEYGPAAEFAAITNALYRPESHTIETPDTLHWRELPTPEREIRFVARELRTALSNGRDPDDLAVVIPDIEGYGGYVEDTFDTFEIPHVTTAATQLNRTFTGSVVHDLLSLAEQNPHTEDLTSLLANPLVNLVSSDQTAALTAAARRRDTVGLEPLLKTVDIETRTQIQELLSTLDVLRSGDLDEATNSLRRLLDEELGLPTAIEDYASETERAVEKQAYDLVVEVLDSFGPLYNISSELSPLAVFSRGFDGIPIRIPQSTASGAVEVMGMLDARMRSFEKVFIVGLTSEQFPVSPERPAFFEEMTDATPRFERPDERLRGRYLFATLLANCDDVILTTPETGDEDSAVVRSPVLDELQRVTDIEPTEGVDDRVGSREDLQRHIADCTDRRAAVDQAGTHGDLSARQTKRTDRGLLCADNRRTASLSQHDGILRPETVDEVYPATKREPYSASRIERYVECGFKFYAEKVLGIEDADPVEVTPTPLETGSYVHDVLESFYAGIQAETNDRDSESVDIAAYERRELEQRLLEVALDELSGTDFEYEGVFYTHWLTELFAGLGDEEANPYAKSTRPYETPERGLFAAFLDEEISQNTDSQPRWFETPFGEGLPDSEAGPCEVERPDGSTVSIRGYIDRVDVTGNDESPRLNLYDYKTGRAPYMTRTTGGTKFQLPIYLLAADKTVSQELLAEATLSATYYQVRPPNDIKVPRGIESKFDSQAELRQFLAEIVPEWLGAVDDAISKGRFHTTLLSSREAHCQYCDYRRACDVRHHRKREHRTEAQSDESAYVPLRAQDDANLREVMSDD
jgi:ATP-dependent helicase/nuclease subunit B